MSARKKALEAVRGMADEALIARLRALKTPPPKAAEPKAEESELSEDETAELLRYYQQDAPPSEA